MALSSFIPEIWSARLLNALDKSAVFAPLCNRDYEGDIAQQGDTVHINTISNPTVGTYTKDTDFASGAETLTATDTTLLIDQAKYFNFAVDDIDKAQCAGDIMDKAMERAGYALTDAADSYIAGVLAGAATADNCVGYSSAVSLTASNVYENIVAVKKLMDKANVPTVGRWMVIPPEMEALLLMDDRFVKNAAQGEQNLVNGWIAKAVGFTFYMSNNCVSASDTYTLTAGVEQAITYAEQVSSVEAYRPEKRFGDAVKGLHLYGAKVVNPAALGMIKCKF